MKKELAKSSLAQTFEPRICYLSDVSSQSSGSEVIKSELLDMSLAQVRFKIPPHLDAVTGAASTSGASREPGV